MPLLSLMLDASSGIHIFGIALEFFLFGITLIGVALFHHHTLKIALGGLMVILFYKVVFCHFDILHHIMGDKTHSGEWHVILNLFGLLTGFAILARHFEDSRLPEHLPGILPSGWRGGWVLLLIVFFFSSFLDNIAAAIIGASLAMVIYKGKVHVGYLAAIVASSNAGGAGSVLGDTTTTMMWIDGVSPLDVLHAFAGSFGAFAFFSFFGAIQQHKLLDFPAIGVWAAILIGMLIRKTNWNDLPHAMSGSVFLLSLVLSASMMPVSELPVASWQSSLVLGFVSSVFDNIPLTKLALDQGGYDWGVLAYAVGYGGSMIWFGSSAGVAISGIFPQAKSVAEWVKSGWHVIVGYLIGFAVLLLAFGWHPHTPHKEHKGQSARESVSREPQ